MSATPLTDAKQDELLHSDTYTCWLEMSKHARELELKLTEATTENTRLRAALATSKDPCVYCQLPKDEMTKCRSGFPGCARADDLMGCPELGAAFHAEELQQELAETQHRIRTLIEERDRARIQADHKWRLREEFEALLGTSDVAIGVELVREAKRGAARYEYLRTLNKREFAALVDECLFEDLNFDAEVDRRRSAK